MIDIPDEGKIKFDLWFAFNSFSIALSISLSLSSVEISHNGREHVSRSRANFRFRRSPRATFVQIFETLFARTYARKRVPSDPAVNSRNARKRVTVCVDVSPFVLWFSFSKFSARASNARQSSRGRRWRIRGQREEREEEEEDESKGKRGMKNDKDVESGRTGDQRRGKRDERKRGGIKCDANRIKRMCFETESVRKNDVRDRGFAHAMTLRMPNHELQMSARQRPSWRPPGPSLSLSADFYCLPQRVHFNFSAGRIYSTAG